MSCRLAFPPPFCHSSRPINSITNHLHRAVLLALLLAWSPWLVLAKTAPPRPLVPTITGVHTIGSNVIVTAYIPAGLKTVTLQSRATNGVGAWKPRDVRHLNGKPTQLIFRLPRGPQVQNFQLTSSTQEELPAAFRRGRKTFAGVPSSASRVPGVFAPQSARAGAADLSLAPTDSGGGTPPPTRSVVESDIWKISGDRLYYFNQYRGLQILDISNPDSATILGSLNLPAAGEQMYLLDHYVLLLARDNCSDASRLVVVDVSPAVPAIVADISVQGSIQESRLVGRALYVASQTFTSSSDDSSGTWGTLVSSFDLADPAAPVARNTGWVAGYGNVISATDSLLFVASQDPENWSQSNLKIFDISAPDGTLQPRALLKPAGQINDKFKINFSGGVLTLISEVNGFNLDSSPSRTVLETFSLDDPSNPVKLGHLEFAPGERLFASRFDNNRVYVVTFHQIDPLWIVDLSDPAHPQITGSVDVPGYSTFIQPLGDRLVTIGQDPTQDWRVAVSLFDVSDLAHPSLLSRVSVGENYSWSEANWDEKAFNVLPDDGLILLPFEGDTINGYAARVQLIDLQRDALTLRGAIDHTLQPRRASVSHGRIVSVSGWEFLAVDTSDRDKPLVTRNLTLAWPVDRVIVYGDYLLEFGTTAFGQGGPALRVARADAPNQLVSQWTLGTLPFLGATTQSNLLYLLQGQNGGYSASGSNSISLTTIDLSQLPNLQIVGQTQTVISNALNAWDVQPIWARPDLLVWMSANSSWFFPVYLAATPQLANSLPGAAISARPASVVANRFLPPWFYGGGSGTELVAFDVSNPSNPSLASEFNLSNDGWNTHNTAFATNGLVYASHTRFNYLPILRPGTIATGQAASPFHRPSPGTAPHWEQIWMDQYYLDVIDYSDAAHPTQRDPVNISGSLAGLSHDGAVLYTVSPHDGLSDHQWLDALAYDGISASLIDSLPLAVDWPSPVLVGGTNIFLGLAARDTNSTSTIETWNLADTGRFSRAGSLTLNAPAESFKLFGGLLASQTGNHLQLIDVSIPQSPQSVGGGGPSNCLWFNAENGDGSLARGLWIPLGDYGVLRLAR